LAEASRKAPLGKWYKAAENANWASPQDVRSTYRQADPIGGEFVVFDTCDNDYRLVVKVDYGQRIVYVWDVLTHREYDAIDSKKLAELDDGKKKSSAPKSAPMSGRKK
jgi:mRNA interferase HigB